MAITLIDKIKPKNNGTFPLVDAADVLMPDGKRLHQSVTDLQNNQLSPVTEENNGNFAQVVGGKWAAVDAIPLLLQLFDAYIEEKFPPVTQAEYDALVEAGTMDKTKYYMIVGDSV